MKDKLQEAAERLVRHEVLHCVSSMMSALCTSAQIGTASSEVEEAVMDSAYNYSECEEENEDPMEVLEHWAVTEWLGEELRARGEVVVELWDFTIWGRCTSGQAIAIDGVIEEIARERLL